MTTYDQMALTDPVGAEQCRDAGRFVGQTIGAVRATDPETSHQAAAKPRVLLRNTVLAAFRTFGPLTDDELVTKVGFLLVGQKPHTIKTLRSRLKREGLVVFAGTWGVSECGSRMRKWRLA